MKKLVLIGEGDFEHLDFGESGESVENVFAGNTDYHYKVIDLQDDTQETLLRVLKRNEVSFEYDSSKATGVYLLDCD